MSVSWLLRDQLVQLDALAAAMHNVSVDGPFSEQTKQLSPEDVRTGLRQIQSWMCKFVTTADLGDMCTKLLDIEQKYRPAKKAVENTSPSKRKRTQSHAAALPHQLDRKSNIEERQDTSLTKFILDTMHKVFASMMKIDGFTTNRSEYELEADSTSSSADPQMLKAISLQRVVPFCCSQLHHTQNVAIRTAASECLGVLTNWFLEPVVDIFIRGLEDIDDSNMREYATIQAAVSNLEFGVETPTQAAKTIEYLQSLHECMKSFDRGVLRKEVCESLKAIFCKVLKHTNMSEAKQAAWDRFYCSGERSHEFFDVYEKIYNTVYKWSKKAKHSMFCYNLLWFMVAASNQFVFYKSTTRGNVFGCLVSGLKKADTRKESLEFIRKYLQHLPTTFVQKDLNNFIETMSHLLTVMLKQKAPEDTEEKELMTEIVTEIGKHHLDFMSNNVIIQCLQQPTYSSKQKEFLLLALGKLAAENQNEVEKYLDLLGPVVMGILTDTKHLTKAERKEDKEKYSDYFDLVVAALKAFPYLRPSSQSHIQQTTAAVGALTRSRHRGIATEAALSMQKFFKLDPQNNLIPTLYCFVDILVSMDLTRTQEIKSQSQYVQIHLKSIVDYLLEEKCKDKQSTLVSANEWTALRQHMEGACLLWLCHHDPWVRSEIARVLELFCSPEFRELEKPPVASVNSSMNNDTPPSTVSTTNEFTSVPFLVDVLFSGEENIEQVAQSETFPAKLREIIKTHYLSFKGVFSWAWTQMHHAVSQTLVTGGSIDELVQSDEMWLKIYTSKLWFLCLSLRPTQVGANMARQNSVPKIFTTPVRLDDYTIDRSDYQDFFNKVLTILHMPTTYAVNKVCHALAECVADLDPSCYDDLFSHLRRPLDRTDAPPTPLKKLSISQSINLNAPTPASSTNSAFAKPADIGLSKVRTWSPDEFYYHEFTLDIFARLVGKCMETKSLDEHAALTESLELVLKQWVRDYNSGQFPSRACRCRRFIVLLVRDFIVWKCLGRGVDSTPGQSTPLRNHRKQPSDSSNNTASPSVRSNSVLSTSYSQLSPIGVESLGYSPNELFFLLTAKLIPNAEGDSGNHSDSSGPSTPVKGRTLRMNTPVGGKKRTSRIKHAAKKRASKIVGTLTRGRFELSRKGFSKTQNQNYNYENSLTRAPSQSFAMEDDEYSDPDFEEYDPLQPFYEDLNSSFSERESGKPTGYDNQAYEGIELLEEAILSAVKALVSAVATFAEEDFQKQVMSFAHRISFRGSHVDAGLASVLTEVLRINPHLMHAFMEMSFPRYHLHQKNEYLLERNIRCGVLNKHTQSCLHTMENGNSIDKPSSDLNDYAHSYAIAFAQAVLNNLIMDLEGWIETRSLPVARVLIFSLLHQTSPTLNTRRASLQLAKLLQSRKKNPLHPGFEGRLYAHKSALMYTQATLQYSMGLASGAKSHPFVIAPLFDEAIYFYNLISAKQGDFLLRLLVPWVSQVGIVLHQKRQVDKKQWFLQKNKNKDKEAEDSNANMHAEVEEKAMKILTSLYHLTEQCHQQQRQPLTSTTVNDLWMKLVSEEHSEIVTPQVVKFLLQKYTAAKQLQNQDPSLNENEKKEQAPLPKMLLLHVSRSRNEQISRTIVNVLIKHIRSYVDTCPEIPCKFRTWSEEKSSVDESCSDFERNTFEIILNLVFENGELFHEHFPRILQNSFVLFHDMPESEAMLSYVSLSLGIRDSGRNASKNNFISALCETDPTLREKWSQEAFVWALNSMDSQVATKSLEVFHKLEGKEFHFGEGQRTLIKIASSLTMAVRLRQVDRIAQIIDILLMPLTIPYDLQGWLAFTSIGWSLLCISEVRYFKLGLSLLSRMFRYDAMLHEEQKNWLLTLGEHLFFFRRNETQNFDAAIVEIAMKGLTSQRTSQKTITVVQSLTQFYADRIPVGNKLTALMLLGNVLLRSIDVLESAKNTSIDNSPEKIRKQQIYYISRAKDCLSFGAFLDLYVQSEENENMKNRLIKFKKIMETFAMTISSHVPEFPLQVILERAESLQRQVDEQAAKTNEHDGTDHKEIITTTLNVHENIAVRLIDIELRQRGAKLEEDNFGEQSTANSLPALKSVTMHDGKNVADFIKMFASEFVNIFDDRETFDFAISFYTSMLKHGPQPWKTPLLSMLGYTLKFSTHLCTQEQFKELSEILVVNFYSAFGELANMAEVIAYLLVEKTNYDGEVKHVFSFVRPRIRAKRHSVEVDVLMTADNEKVDSKKEVLDSLMRIQKETMPILQHMYEHPRAVHPRYQKSQNSDHVGVVLPEAEVDENKFNTLRRVVADAKGLSNNASSASSSSPAYVSADSSSPTPNLSSATVAALGPGSPGEVTAEEMAVDFETSSSSVCALENTNESEGVAVQAKAVPTSPGSEQVVSPYQPSIAATLPSAKSPNHPFNNNNCSTLHHSRNNSAGFSISNMGSIKKVPVVNANANSIDSNRFPTVRFNNNTLEKILRPCTLRQGDMDTLKRGDHDHFSYFVADNDDDETNRNDTLKSHHTSSPSLPPHHVRGFSEVYLDTIDPVNFSFNNETTVKYDTNDDSTVAPDANAIIEDDEEEEEGEVIQLVDTNENLGSPAPPTITPLPSTTDQQSSPVLPLSTRSSTSSNDSPPPFRLGQKTLPKPNREAPTAPKTPNRSVLEEKTSSGDEDRENRPPVISPLHTEGKAEDETPNKLSFNTIKISRMHSPTLSPSPLKEINMKI